MYGPRRTCYILMMILEAVVLEAVMQDLSTDDGSQSHCTMESKS